MLALVRLGGLPEDVVGRPARVGVRAAQLGDERRGEVADTGGEARQAGAVGRQLLERPGEAADVGVLRGGVLEPTVPSEALRARRSAVIVFVTDPISTSVRSSAPSPP